MLYDLIYVPMQVFEPPYSVFLFILDLLAQLYWTIDIPIMFMTAIYVEHGLEVRFGQIARSYARGWLTFDLLVTLPQWYTYFDSNDSDPQLSFMKNIRVVRLMRLLRLLRL